MSADVIPIQTAGSAGHAGFETPDGSRWVKVTPGQEPPKAAGGGGGEAKGPNMSTRLDRLEQHRTWIWVVIGLAFTALGASFLFLLSQIDSRFDRVDEPLDELRGVVSGQSATLDAIDKNLVRIETRMEAGNDVNSASSDQAE